MAVKSATLSAILNVIETLDTNVVASGAGKHDITHEGFSVSSLKMDSTTTGNPVTKCAFFEKPLVAGAGSVDLTALLGTNGAIVVGTGLKVQAVIFKNKEAQSPIAITEGAANGHALLGAAFLMTLRAKQLVLAYLADDGPDVAAADKIWDLAGTGTDALQIGVVLG